MKTPTPDTCKCGELPTVYEGKLDDSNLVQVRCKCGNHGAQLLYQKEADRERTIVAACDGWYFGLRMN